VHGHHSGRPPVPHACSSRDQHVLAAPPQGADDPGGSVTALADLLSPDQRERLAARLRELSEIEALVRERGQQQPPPEPPTLAALSTTSTYEQALSQAG
jgi:hypothetical protein